MRKALLILLLIFYSFAAYCQHPFTQNLKSVSKITFPDTPKATPISSGTVYIYKDQEAHLYFAQCSTLEKSAKDLFNSHILDSTYNGYINGVTGSIKSHIFYRKDIEIQGLKGVEFDYRADLKNRTYYNYQQVFYFNEALISYAYWTPDSIARDDKKIKAFFNTYKLTLKPEDVRQKNASDLGFIAGHAIAVVTLFVIIVLLCLLVVFLVKKATKKQKR